MGETMSDAGSEAPLGRHKKSAKPATLDAINEDTVQLQDHLRPTDTRIVPVKKPVRKEPDDVIPRKDWIHLDEIGITKLTKKVFEFSKDITKETKDLGREIADIWWECYVLKPSGLSCQQQFQLVLITLRT